jgi:AcrR family transcriptional regulator
MSPRAARTRRIGRPRAAARPPGWTRQRLLEAAAEVFAEQGYSGAAIDAIASRAGVTGGALYRHFASKAELLLEVVAQAVHALPLAERLAGADAPEPRFFAQLVSIYAEPGLRRVRRLAIEIHAAASRDAEAARLLLEFNRRMHASLCEQLARCVAAGTAPASLDVARSASLLLVLVMGLAHLDTLEPERIGDAGFARFLEGAVGTLLRP